MFGKIYEDTWWGDNWENGWGDSYEGFPIGVEYADYVVADSGTAEAIVCVMNDINGL